MTEQQATLTDKRKICRHCMMPTVWQPITGIRMEGVVTETIRPTASKIALRL